MRSPFGRVFGLAMHWQILIAMVVGAGLGVLLGNLAGEFETDGELDYGHGKLQVYGMSAGVEVRGGKVWIRDARDEVMVQVSENDSLPTGDNPEPTRTVRRVFVGQLDLGDANPQTPGELDKLEQEAMQGMDWPALPARVAAGDVTHVNMESVDTLKSADPAAYALFKRKGRSWARFVADTARMLGNLFLRMLKMVSVPLVIVSLLSGVMGLGAPERFGRMFGRTALYYLATSTLAIIVGLTVVNVLRPGKGGNNALAKVVASAESADGEEKGKSVSALLFEQIENMIPVNPVTAAAEGNFLSLISFTLAFGIAALLAGGKVAETTRSFAEAGFGAMMKLTLGVIRLAPIGVFGLMLYATASQGLGVFASLAWYMVAVTAALLIHATVILPLIVRFVAKRSPLEFGRAMSPALLMAFSSSSSNGTLPVTLASVEERAGVKNRVSSFVLPLGATINMDGTALYEVIAVIFIANVSGVELSLAQQVVIAYTALLVSIGAAGIPQAGLVMMIIILQAVGLPTEAQGLIIAVDRVLDMGRTVVNVWSDSCGCAVINRFDQDEVTPAASPA
ncbi:MAG: dicarboxylate/amino acid:cation symporter [Pirellulales bacterium]|nr:dicarboxylate/amino acid:cation symporter [Pirellulales bacterium]